MKRKKLLLLGILSVLGIGLLGILASYAWYSFVNNGLGITSITTNGITFSYKEGSNALSLNDAMPMSDENGKYQDNYFEFEINSKTPTEILIPYYITARKGANSSDIDDAIKISLSRVMYNETDVYSFKNRYGYFTLEECENEIAKYGSSSDTCVKVYSAGDVAPDLYTYHAVGGSFTLDECQEEIANAPVDVSATCVEKDGAYAIQYTRGEYYSLEQCEADNPPSGTCLLLSNSSDVLEEDMYTLEYMDGYYTREECEAEYGDSVCELIYPAGTYAETEEELKVVNYADLAQYENDTIDLSKYTEKLLLKSKVPENTNYKETYRIRMWIDENTDFTQAKYNNASFGLTINVYSEGKTKVEMPTAPGLYNEYGELLATWDELVNDYGLDIESSMAGGTWSNTLQRYTYSNPTSFGYILEHNSELADGTMLVIGNVSKIGYNAFAGSNLTSVVIPEGVTEIDYGAFIKTKLTSITIPASVTNIGTSAFENTRNLETVTFAKNSQLISLGDKAFWGSDKLSKIVLPSQLTHIGYMAFNNCHKLTSINIPASVTTIAARAFEYSGLTTLTLEEPSQLSSVGSDAFNHAPWYDNLSDYGSNVIYLNGVEIPTQGDCYRGGCVA